MSTDRVTIYVCAYKCFGSSTVQHRDDDEGLVALSKDLEGRWRQLILQEGPVIMGTRLRKFLIDSFREGDKPVELHWSPPLDSQFRGSNQTITVYRAMDPNEREKFLLGFTTVL